MYALVTPGDTSVVVVSLVLKGIAKPLGQRRKMKIINEKASDMMSD